MSAILKSLEGKKTYIVAFIVAAIGLAEAFGWTPPGWLTTVLEAAGLGALRSAVK